MIDHEEGGRVARTSEKAQMVAKGKNCDVRDLEPALEPQQEYATDSMHGWGSPASEGWRMVDKEVWEWMKEGQARGFGIVISIGNESVILSAKNDCLVLLLKVLLKPTWGSSIVFLYQVLHDHRFLSDIL